MTAPEPGSDIGATRFSKQERFAPLGVEGQKRLLASRVVVIGTGALGGSAAQNLVRAGVGRLLLVDRDVVEPSNLPRQVLFDERHARDRVPKVEAARETLARIGGPTRVDIAAVQLDGSNADEWLGAADLVIDGTDNLATRYLINDWCVRAGVPWIYGGVVGAAGLVLAVLPGRGPCLRCLFPEPAPPGSLATCDTAGVILPAVAAVAALQCGLALALLGGDPDSPPTPRLLELDAWGGAVRQIELAADPACPACAERRFDFLERAEADQPLVLCGRLAVQLPSAGRVDLEAMEVRLAGLGGEVRRTRSALVWRRTGHAAAGTELELTLFADGRALVEGTEDPVQAQAFFDRSVGR